MNRGGHIGGFSVIEAPDLDGAISWAKRLSEALVTQSRDRPVAPRVGAREPTRRRGLVVQASPPDAAREVSMLADDRLRLIFTCCHQIRYPRIADFPFRAHDPLAHRRLGYSRTSDS